MASKAKLRRKIRRLKRENLDLIIDCNAAMARAGGLQEELDDYLNDMIVDIPPLEAPRFDG